MSAFVVDDATINCIISFLAIDREGDWLRRTIQRETGLDLTKSADQQALGKAMHDLNCRAVNERYGEGADAEFQPQTYQYARSLNTNRIRAFKALECWCYQCAEGSVPGDSLLYACMLRVRGHLAESIVHSLPAYRTAPWD